MSTLSFDPKVKRWRRMNGQFHKPPVREIRTTTRYFTKEGKRKQVIVDFYFDFRAHQYRSTKTGKFVKPTARQLVIPRKSRPHRRGIFNRWKVSIGPETKPTKRRGSWVEWDVVGKFIGPEDIVKYLGAKSPLFREIMDTGAQPKIALAGPEKGPERFVARRIWRRPRTYSKEIENSQKPETLK